MHIHVCTTLIFLLRRAPPLTVPSGDYLLSVVQDSFAIAIVTYTITVSLGRVLARRFDYDIHSNQVSCNAYLCPMELDLSMATIDSFLFLRVVGHHEY